MDGNEQNGQNSRYGVNNSELGCFLPLLRAVAFLVIFFLCSMTFVLSSAATVLADLLR